MTGGLHGGTVTSAEIRAACDLDTPTPETLGVAASGAGMTRWRYARRRRESAHARRAEGSAWNRIPKGVADKIAAMRGAK